MSTIVSSWVWHSPDTKTLKGGQMLVLLALADIANDDGDIIYTSEKRGNGSQSALARKARVSIATFRRMTQDLQTLGLLDIGRTSTRDTNRYRILMTAQNERTLQLGTAHDERTEPVDNPVPGAVENVTPLILSAHSYERSHRSTVSGHKERINKELPPNPRTAGGPKNSPTSKVREYLAGSTLATDTTRRCTKHTRQRSSCLDCWTPRPLTTADVPWCGDGDCDEVTRLRYDPELHIHRRCPDCHPILATAARRDRSVS